jgi:hypothetical protein
LSLPIQNLVSPKVFLSWPRLCTRHRRYRRQRCSIVDDNDVDDNDADDNDVDDNDVDDNDVDDNDVDDNDVVL